jgi:hypothetical protein
MAAKFFTGLPLNGPNAPKFTGRPHCSRPTRPSRADRAGAGHHRSRPVPASPPSPAAPPARACDANPLAGFGSEASKDQHYVLDAAHTTKGMTAQ